MEGAVILSVTEDHKLTNGTTFTNGTFSHGGDTFESLSTPEQQDWNTKLSPFEDYLIASYLIIVGIAGFLLNIVIVAFIAKKWKKLEPVELLIGNMALANMTFVLCYGMVIQTTLQHQWVYGNTGVIVYAFCGTFCSLVNIYSLVVMCVWRYIKTCVPRYNHWVGRRNVAYTVCCVYVFSFIWAMFPLFGWGQYGMELGNFTYSINWKTSKSFVTSTFCVFVVIPNIVMVLGYGRITIFLKKNNKQCNITCLTLCMCLAFILCWFPYGVVSMWAAYGTDIPSVRIFAVTLLLAKSSVLVHPILYFFMIRRYRCQLLEMLRSVVHVEVIYNVKIDIHRYVSVPAQYRRNSIQYCLEASSLIAIGMAGGDRIIRRRKYEI